PVFLELQGKTALVVGGGKVALRKVETLIECGAFVHLVSRELTDRLREWVDAGRVRLLGREFREEHLEGVFLVFVATNDSALNKRVSESAQGLGMLVNVADQPAHCNFIVPSMVTRGDLLLAISTAGKSPALARKIREELEVRFGPEYKTFLTLMGGWRKEVLSLGLPQEENSRIFHEIVDSPVLEAFSKGDREQVNAILARILPKDWNVEFRW
ncbi:MAG: bifunctional precorrin-2 dehydrogenase/sirohydrochlorin ferrochelatase, partial [Deltaproteobacteria bacterium]|nr:bifunctional precorrin-2 dehydrogenase/sirohydrochlorin ferrochelatase [Deltaproteobacteria bacterium]